MYDSNRLLAIRITLIYLVVSVLWILVSDYVVHFLIGDPNLYAILSTAKGWGFVALSALLIYVMLARAFKARERFNQELESYARRQEAVSSLRQLALTDGTIDALLSETVMLVSLALDVDYSSVLELQPDQHTLLLRAGEGWQVGLLGKAVSTASSDTLAGCSLDTDDLLCVDDIRTDPRFANEPYLSEHQVVSSMHMLIVGRSQSFGVLGVHTTQIRQFSPDERNFLKAIANALSTAIAREQAEAEIRRHKTLLECQSEASLDGIMVVDLQNTVISYNQRFLEMWHILPELMATRDGGRIFTEAMQAQLVEPENFVEHISYLFDHRVARSQTQVALRDGRIFERYSAPVEDRQGIYHGRVFYYRDITDFKQAQEALRQSEEMFRNLVNSMEDVIFTLDREQRHTGLYGRWLERYQIPPETFLGKTSREIAPDESIARVHEAANTRALGGEFVVYEWSMTQPESYFQTSLSPVHGAEGEITGLVGVGRDITALKQAEESLRISATNFRTLADTTSAVILIFRDDQVLYVNAAAESVTGYSQQELLLQSTSLLIPADQREVIRSRVASVLQGQQRSLRYEALIRTRSGEERWLDVTLGRIEFEQQLAGLVTAFDITERKQAEETLRQRNRELSALNQVTEAVSLFLDLPAVLNTLHRLLAEQLHVAAGAILLYHETNDCLSIESAWGLSASVTEMLDCMPVTHAYNEQVVREKFSVLQQNIQCEAPALYQVLQADNPSLRSYLGVPILAQGEIQGVIDLFDTAFTTDQARFFGMLGQHVGTAIQKARLFDEVRIGQERLQTLSHRLVQVQEEERRMIARELHDEVGQILTGLNLSLELIARLPIEQVPMRLGEAQEMINDLMMRVREMSLELRPPMLDDLGLLPALVWHFERYTGQTGIQVIFKHSGLERQRFTSEIETAVYRLVQEALTNVARYAGVQEATVRLWVGHGMLGVQVEDAGNGFDPETALASHSSSGLSGMRERALLLGGQCSIESAPGEGSCIVVEIPLW